jgi:MerR HTH family regulatory protein
MLSMKTKNLYSQGDLKKIFAHIPSNTLLFWAKEGLLSWTDETRDARGIHRKYSLDDLVRVAFIEELLAVGYSTTAAALTADTWAETVVRGFLIIAKTHAGRVDEGRDVGYCEFWEEIPEKLNSLRGASSIHVIDVDQIVANVKALLERV